MTQRLIIHIGTHKTGSTAIQKALLANYLKMAKQESIFFVNLVQFGSLKSLMQATECDERLVRDLASFLNEKVRQAEGTFVASSEALSGNPFGLYANAPVVAQMLHEASRRFAPEIVVFLRRQDQFLQSVFMQGVHEGRDLEIDEFISQNDLALLDWNAFLMPYADLFGSDNMHVLPYDPEILRRTDIVRLFNTVLGSQVLGSLEGSEEANVGFSMHAADLFKTLKPDLNLRQQGVLRRALQQVDNKGYLREYNLLDRRVKGEIVERFREANQALCDEWYSGVYELPGFSPPVYIEATDSGEDADANLRLIAHLLEVIDHQELEIARLGDRALARLWRPVYRFLSSTYKRVFLNLR